MKEKERERAREEKKQKEMGGGRGRKNETIERKSQTPVGFNRKFGSGKQQLSSDFGSCYTIGPAPLPVPPHPNRV